MQTYSPIRGMTVCVSGGEYVKREDADAEIAELKERARELEADNKCLKEALEKIESLSLCYEGDECGSKQIASEALKLAGKEGE